MKYPRVFRHLSLCLLVSALLAATATAGDKWDEWKPVDPAQLALKTPLVEKDADAEAFFWEVRVADELEGGNLRTVHTNYIRIKIFTERGREKQSRVDIPFGKIFGINIQVKDIAARTIKPDGTIVELKKEDIFERTIAKSSGLKLKAKSFAMPGAEPGSLIEYRWKEVRGDSISDYDRLEFSREIPVQLVKYYIKPLNHPLFPYGMRAKPFYGNTTEFKKESGGFYSTTMSNVPAYREEPRMPPEYAVRPWMLIYYTEDKKLSTEAYWKDYGKEVYEDHKSAMKVNDDIKRAAAEAVGDATTPEQKLERIFAYVRSKVKNVYDDASGLSREQLDKLKDNKTPADTLKRGQGNWHDIDMLFGALATAAGFEARVAKVANRGEYFFDPSFPNSFFLRRGTENIAVRVGDQWRFYDPGTTYVEPGMLRWQEESQDALISDPKEPVFVKTPTSPPAKSVERRTAKLRLGEDGTLEGDVRIEYTGHLGLDMKENYDENTPAEREETLKERVKARMSTAEISDIRVENVTDPSKPFTYAYRIRVPGYAQRTGKRLFFQPAFFQFGYGPLFPTSERKNHIYFHYPWTEEDRVEIDLPEGFALDSAEAPAPFDAGELSAYRPRAQVTTDGKTLIYLRTFFFNANIIPAQNYSQLKAYFDELHKQDSHTLALKQGAAAPATSSTATKPSSN
jgi:hypothetical protein